MKTPQTIQVTGTAADHTIHVLAPVTFPTLDAATLEHKAKGRKSGDVWQPENRSEFKSVGQAVGWLRKTLKKNGWPKATVWEVETVIVPGYPIAIQAVLVGKGGAR